MTDPVTRRRWLRGIAAAGVAALALVACGGNGGGTSSSALGSLTSAYNATKGNRTGQLVYSDWEQVTDLNPISTSAATTQQVTNVIWSPLWWFGPDNKPIP